MQKTSWTVTQPNGEVSKSPSRQKLPFMAPKIETDGMKEGQKMFVREFNAMQKRLIEIDEMHSR